VKDNRTTVFAVGPGYSRQGEHEQETAGTMGQINGNDTPIIVVIEQPIRNPWD